MTNFGEFGEMRHFEEFSNNVSKAKVCSLENCRCFAAALAPLEISKGSKLYLYVTIKTT